MAIGTAAVTFDIADQLGNDFDPRRTKVWITTNVPGDTVIDKAGNKIRLGSGDVTLNADGTGSMLVWVPGADANPSSWQTTVHVDYPDRNKAKGRASKSFGPFTITANADLADLVAEMPVQPEYLATVLATVQDMIDEATDSTGPALAAMGQRVNGYTDHGNVSGAVTFNGPAASHRFDATGPTTITLAGFGEGGVATLICFSGAEDVTVNNAGDVELVDATAWSAEYARGTWISGGGGGTPATPDSSPPSAVTTLLATGGVEQIALTWSASTDAESSVSYRYRAWLTSGGATGSWTSTTGTSATITGLAAGAYTAEVYAYSSGGSTTPDTAGATVTAPVLPYGVVVAADNPTYYWPLDDAPGTTYPRQIGSHVGAITYTLDGVTFGGTTLGGTGTGATFAGSGNGIVTSVAPGSGCAEFTFETLVHSVGNGGIFGRSNDYYPSAHKSGPQVTGVYMGQLVNGTGAPTTAFHLAIRSKSQGSGNPKLEVFINGVQTGEAIANAATLLAYPALSLGRDKYSDSALNGRLSDFAVYENVALSNARILAHAQAAGKA